MPFTACHTHHQPNPPTTPAPENTTTPHTTTHPQSQGSRQRAGTSRQSNTRSQQRAHQAGDAHSTQLQRNLMLASTIQISNNNPTPLDATPPPTGGTQDNEPTGREPSNHTPPPPAHVQNTRHPGVDVGLIPQNPNSVPPPTRPARPPKQGPSSSGTRDQTPLERGPGSRAAGGEVSMIPQVNTTIRAPPPDPRHNAGGTDEATGVCSLERR